MKRHRITGNRWLQATLMAALSSLIALPVLAEDSPEALPHPSRLVDYVAPSLLQTNVRRNIPAPALLPIRPADNESTTQVIAHSTVLTAGERWMNFDSEYGITEKEPTSMGRFIQDVKFQIDTVTFGATEAARRLEFTHRVGNSWSTDEPYDVPDELRYLVPLFDTLADGQVKSVITMHDPETGKVFAGLQYVAGFGPK